MSWLEWLRGLFRRPPGRVTNVRFKVTMKEIALEWAVPAVRDDGSSMPATEIAYTEVSLSTDAGKNFTSLAKVKPDETQVIKRSPALDGAYLFRLVVFGTNGKKGKPIDCNVPVDTPAPGVVTAVKASVT